MAVRTDEVRDLVDFAPEGFRITSFYLDVDAGEFPSPDLMHTSLDSLLHTAEEDREKLKDELSHQAYESLREDLQKIEEYVKREFKREDINGLAIFSCSAQDFWEVVGTPTRLRNRVVFGPHPYVSPLARFLSHTKPTAILLTDREQARIITMSHGDVREWSSFEDFVPHHSAAGGWSQMRYQRRSDHWAKHHVDKAAELTLKLLQHYPFDWLILGTDVGAEHDLKEGLHPYLKERLVGEIHVRIDAPLAEVLEEARGVREHAENTHIDDLIAKIQEYAGAGGRGTIGLEDTLGALNEQKVHILLVQDGLSRPGAECPNCGLLLATQRETCPACNEPARPVENVVDSAIQRAIESGSVVEVATEYEKLEPIDCIGSIMYY